MATFSDKDLGLSAGTLESLKQETSVSQAQLTNTVVEKGEPTEESYQADQVIPLMKQDMNFFAAMAMPFVFQFLFPIVFKAVWQWIIQYLHQDRVFPKLALGLPRGFGKTTVMKLLILYIILFTKKKFILIFCGTEKKAVNIISDVMNMLSNPNMVRLFGDWKLGSEIDQQGLKKFGYRGRNIIILGMGTGGDIRGYNLDNARPDFMLFDDIQSREDADSPVLSEAIENWFFGTAMKAKSPSGCVYLFVGNMYPTENSLLRKLKKNKTWIKFIAGGILEDGSSLWEELQPIAQLLDEYEADCEAGKPEIFISEVMNDENANMNNLIDLTKVRTWDLQYELNLGSFIIIDPSNDKANSDDVSIGNFQLCDTTPVLNDLVADTLSPGQTILEAFKMCARNHTSLILVEANAYQYSLLYWFEQLKLQYGLHGIQCLPIYSGGLSKNTRIVTMFKQLVKAELGFTDNVRARVIHQISQFKPLRRDNVDGILDLLAYAPRVLTEFGQYITINSPLTQDDEANSSFNYNETDNCEF